MVNSLTSFLVQVVFPWELANLGAATFTLQRVRLSQSDLSCQALPETKGEPWRKSQKNLSDPLSWGQSCILRQPDSMLTAQRLSILASSNSSVDDTFNALGVT